MPSVGPEDEESPPEGGSAKRRPLSRRQFLSRTTGVIAVGAVGAAAGSGVLRGGARAEHPFQSATPGSGDVARTVSRVDRQRGTQLLRDGSFENGRRPQESNHDWAVQLAGVPTGGTFTLTAQRGGSSETTAPVPYDVTSAQIKAALETLSTVTDVDVSVVEHAGTWSVTFEARAEVPTLSGDGSGLTGGTAPTLRVDRLDAWGGEDGPIEVVEHGAHGAQSAVFVASGVAAARWRGPFVPCLPGETLSIGADTRGAQGSATWTIGLRYFDRAFGEIADAEFSTEANTDTVWQRRTGVAPPAPDGAAWAAFALGRSAGIAAAHADRLQLDTVLVTAGVYSGPMLPALILAGAVHPGGFLLSAYAGRGCDLLRARILRDGVEVPGVSPTPPGVVAPYGWAFTSAAGLEPMTGYQVQMEARNTSSETWEPFGGLAEMPTMTAPADGVPSEFAVALMGCSFASADRITWDHVMSHVSPTGRPVDYLNWGGDWHYADRQFDDEAYHRELFEKAWYGVSGLRELLQRVPLIADQMSDHDGGEGGNNHDSFQNSSVVACQRAVSQMIPTPELEVPDCRFSVTLLGRVLFVSLDTRSVDRSPTSSRDGPAKSLLGAEQRVALFKWLDWADERNYLAMIQSDMVWDCDDLGPKLDWWGSYAYERDLVADRLRGRRVIMCDYDLHALRVRNASRWGGMPVIGSAGATANTNVHSPEAVSYYDQLWPDPSVGVSAPARHWHEAMISDDGSTITVAVTGFDPRQAAPVTRATFSFSAPLRQD